MEEYDEYEFENLPKGYHLDVTEDLLEFKHMPDEVSISVMVMACKIGTEIDVINVGKYMPLLPDRIVTVKYAVDKHKAPIIRTLRPKKIRRKLITRRKKIKKKKVFVNQVTVEIMSPAKLNGKPVNVKLFRNGSMQFTGVKSIFDFCYAVDILLTELKKTFKVRKQIEKDDKIITKNVQIQFVQDIPYLELTDSKICMLNTGFKFGNRINLEELNNLLEKDGHTSTYSPSDHACVDIKYKYKGITEISIFVFESGSIMITGVKTIRHIQKAYKLITGLLEKYGDKVVSVQIDAILKKIRKNKKLMKEIFSHVDNEESEVM
jgi:TATA-box binding protein (TBP) (component of TFIID and TFIIIB)